MWIGVDICNTIANVNLELVRRFNIALDVYPAANGPPRDFFSSPEGVKFFWNVEPFPHAAQALRRIAGAGYRLAYVSSRPRETYFVTKRWLALCGFPPGPVMLGLAAERKVALATRYGLAGFFEDDPAVAAALAGAGIRVWLKDWPYNRKVGVKQLVRFREWREIARSIIPVCRQD
jgi:hypothetical protein